MASEMLHHRKARFIVRDDPADNRLGNHDFCILRPIPREEIARYDLVKLVDCLRYIESIRLSGAPATELSLQFGKLMRQLALVG